MLHVFRIHPGVMPCQEFPILFLEFLDDIIYLWVGGEINLQPVLDVNPLSRFTRLGVRGEVEYEFVQIHHIGCGDANERTHRTASVISPTSDISLILQYIIRYLFDDGLFEILMLGAFLLEQYYLFVPLHVFQHALPELGHQILDLFLFHNAYLG